MELNKAQRKIVYDIAQDQTRALTYILLSEELLNEIYTDIQNEEYDVTKKEVLTEVRKQLNQWAKVKKNPHEFGNLLDSTEQGYLRHFIFKYMMHIGHSSDTADLWTKLNINEQLKSLNLN